MIGIRSLKIKKSSLTITEYCKQNNISISSFYKNKSRLKDMKHEDDIFIPVEVVQDFHSHISMATMTIDGHYLEFDPVLLDKIIGALK